MPSIAVRDVAETRDETPKYDLLWSLQPVFNGLRILGFDLDVNRPGSVHRRRAFLGLKMLVVFVTGESSVALILQGFRDINKGSPIYFSVFLLLMAFLSISFTITLLGAVQFKWSALWDKVREVERSTTFTADFYKLMGKAATPSILFLISLNLIETVVLINERSEPEIEAKVQKIITDAWKDLVLVLYLSFTWIVSSAIQIMIEEAELVELASVQRILKWEKQYFLLLELIDGVNQFFGPMLVSVFAGIFVAIIVFNYRFIAMLFGETNGSFYAPAIRLPRNVMLMSGFIFGAVVIKQKVSAFTKQLNKLKFADGALEVKVGLLIVKINQNIPRISPMGMFEVDPTLIPTLICATITNVLVIAQFAERKQ